MIIILKAVCWIGMNLFIWWRTKKGDMEEKNGLTLVMINNLVWIWAV